jgi:demethylmenaquinone methyltransferase / 2-methoxy-6-polyprenyl-1,4-benzoquinol methylase
MSASVNPDVIDEGLRAKDPARIAGMFDAIAPRYDLLNFVLSAGRDRRWRRRAVEALDLRPSELMLDVCTGTADMAVEAMRRQPRLATIVGVDFSLQMLRLARPKLKAAGTVPAILAQADATALPLPDEEVDAATVAFGIRNVQRPERACAELARVIRPGGRLAVLEFGLPRSRLFRAGYGWYANRILPLVGRFVSRHRNAYAYLPESVARFQAPEVFAGLLTANGFSRVSTVPLTFGVVYLYIARK